MTTTMPILHFAQRVLHDLALDYRKGDSPRELLREADRRLRTVEVDTLTTDGARTHADLSAMIKTLGACDDAALDGAFKAATSLQAVARKADLVATSTFIAELVELSRSMVGIHEKVPALHGLASEDQSIRY